MPLSTVTTTTQQQEKKNEDHAMSCNVTRTVTNELSKESLQNGNGINVQQSKSRNKTAATSAKNGHKETGKAVQCVPNSNRYACLSEYFKDDSDPDEEENAILRQVCQVRRS